MLTEDKRTQLDGIVQQMVANKESDQNIQAVVDDFKTKYSTQTKGSGLLSRIGSSLAERGKAIKESLVASKEQQISPTQAGLNIAGQVVGAPLDVIGEGIKSIIPKAAEQGLAKLSNKIADVVTENPRVLAGLNSINEGIDKYNEWKTQNPEDAKSLEAVVNIGTLLTGVKGSGAVSGEVKAGIARGEQLLTTLAEKRATKQALNLQEQAFEDALSISRPKITPKIEAQAFKEGRIGKQGIFTPAEIAPSAQEIKMAEAVQPLLEDGRLTAKLVDRNPSLAQNIIKQEVSRINQGVKELVNDPLYNQPFNRTQLKGKINNVFKENRLIFAGDATAEKAYKAVIQKFYQFIDKKNVSGLFEARQSFDKYIRNNFPQAFKEDVLTGSVNPRAQALRDVRTIVNDYIADLLPENNPYKALLRKESDLIRITENMSTKIKGITTKSKLKKALTSPTGRLITTGAIGGGVVGGGLSLID